jgi:PAS domain S-box-containing protein
LSLLTSSAADRYFELLDAVGQAAIATDIDGTITRWNASAEELYGWNRTEVLGRDILQVTPSDVSRSQAVEIMKAIASGEVWSGEFLVRGREGGPFLVDVTDVPVIGEADRVVGVAGLSARPSAETRIHRVFERFAVAAKRSWPGQIVSRSTIPEDVVVESSEPHLAQLLSLLLLRNAEWLQEGGVTDIEARIAQRSIFDTFGLPVRPAAHIRMSRLKSESANVPLHDILRPAVPTRFAASLVRATGGVLLAAVRADDPHALHLLLPVRATSARA